MRLNQWIDEVYEKTKGLPTVLFSHDVPGGMILQCPCGEEFLDLDDDKCQVCPKCKKDLIFPRTDW